MAPPSPTRHNDSTEPQIIQLQLDPWPLSDLLRFDFDDHNITPQNNDKVEEDEDWGDLIKVKWFN